MKKNKKGFTLIELLVVMSVIAILAATVMVNMQGAGDRARDTRAISAMGQLRTIAQIVYAQHGSFGTNLCASNSTFGAANDLQTLQAEIDANNGTGVIECIATNNTYCISTGLNEGSWCIDSTGVSKSGVVCGTVACN